MGRLTDDMTRLIGEIHAGRAERSRMIRDIRHATAEMKHAVADMQAGFRSARADMARTQRRMLHGFMVGLRSRVAFLRKEMADDLAGAHRLWVGTTAMPRATRW